MNNKTEGMLGENLAESYLIKKGIKIINKNYLTKYGEIDLIGIHNQTIIFTEVKLRNNKKFGEICEAINYKKVCRLKKTAEFFLKNTDIQYNECRFDVILIRLCKNGLYKIEWIQNFIN